MDTEQQLEQQLSQLEQTRRGITEQLADVSGAIRTLEKQSSNFLEDIFRPDNPKRQKAALRALNDLRQQIQQSNDQLIDIQNLMVDAKLVIGRMHQWTTYIRSLIPLLVVSDSVQPELTNTPIPLSLRGLPGLSLSGLTGGPLNIAVSSLSFASFGLLGVLTGGIVSAEQKKSTYEEIRDSANKARRLILSEQRPLLEQAISDLQQFFNDLGASLHAAGLVADRPTEPASVRKVFESLIGQLELWRTAFDIGMKAASSDSFEQAAQLAAQTVAKTSADRQTLTRLFEVAFLLEHGQLTADIAARLGLSEHQVIELKVRKLLFDGVLPSEIVETLQISSEQVHHQAAQCQPWLTAIGVAVPAAA